MKGSACRKGADRLDGQCSNSEQECRRGRESRGEVPGANLVVAGDGPVRDEIHKLAAELLPGRFQQITLPAAEMPALYRSADAFMHLSVDKSFGNVFVEALACGLPIIAYDMPRTRWIIGDAGFFAASRRLRN